MKLTVDVERCAGHAMCEDLAPEVFTLSEEGRVVLLIDEPPESMRDVVEEAVRMCPCVAITLTD